MCWLMTFEFTTLMPKWNRKFHEKSDRFSETFIIWVPIKGIASQVGLNNVTLNGNENFIYVYKNIFSAEGTDFVPFFPFLYVVNNTSTFLIMSIWLESYVKIVFVTFFFVRRWVLTCLPKKRIAMEKSRRIFYTWKWIGKETI